MAAVTQYHKVGGLEQQKITVSQLCRLEVQSQGRAVLPLRQVGRNPSLPLLSFWWWPPVLGVPWSAAASLQSLPVLSHGVISVCLSSVAVFPVFIEIPDKLD